MLSLPSQTYGNGVHCKLAYYLKTKRDSLPKGKEKKEKEIFLKKLVSLKRSCTFAAAN